MDVLMCGVGGQGIITASNLLAEAARVAGYDVKKSEVHGMSQRGGSVFAHVRWGERVRSPIIPLGSAEFILSLEIIEAARYLPFLKRSGKVICDDRIILPSTVKKPSEGEAVKKRLVQALGPNLVLVPADEVCAGLSNMKVAGTVVLRALADRLDFEDKVWRKAMKNVLPEKVLAINMLAFGLGDRQVPGE